MSTASAASDVMELDVRPILRAGGEPFEKIMQAVGALKPGRIVSVTRFGLFVRLAESGADGLVPISRLPEDYYVHDEKRHALVGRRWGREFRLGVGYLVRIREADALTGSLTLDLVEGEAPATPSPLSRPGETTGKPHASAARPGRHKPPARKGRSAKGRRRRGQAPELAWLWH